MRGHRPKVPEPRLTRASVPRGDRDPLSCSFCGLPENEVEVLVAGPLVFICDGCVDIAKGIVDVRKGKNHGTS